MMGSFAGRRHHQLAARKVRNSAAEGLLLDGAITQALLLGGQGSGETCGTCADDHDIQPVAALHAGKLCDEVHRLHALADRVADEAHAAELACDEEAGHVCLECWRDDGQFDAALLRAEDERDGLRGAGGGAGAMADAGCGVDDVCLAIDEANHSVFGAGCHACGRAAAERQVDLRMERGWLGEAGLFRIPSMSPSRDWTRAFATGRRSGALCRRGARRPAVPRGCRAMPGSV